VILDEILAGAKPGQATVAVGDMVFKVSVLTSGAINLPGRRPPESPPKAHLPGVYRCGRVA